MRHGKKALEGSKLRQSSSRVAWGNSYGWCVSTITGGAFCFLEVSQRAKIMIDSEKKNTSHIVKINPLFLGFVGIMVLVVLGLLFANKTQLLSKKLNSSTYDPAQSFNPDPSASAGSLSTKQIADSDPIVSCGPGVHSGQYISDRQSNCKNYVDCGLYDEKGNTTWTLMLNDVCNKKHNEKNANTDNGSSTNDSIDFRSVECEFHGEFPYSRYLSNFDDCRCYRADVGISPHSFQG